MRVLVLGRGFMGGHVATVFAAAGHEVIALSRRDGLDLLDPLSALASVKAASPDLVVNAAAHVGSLNYVTDNAAEVCHDNAVMLANTYAALASLRRPVKVVNPLANCTYPGDANPQVEAQWLDGPMHPSVAPYGAARRFGWELSRTYRQKGVSTLNLIVPNAYGPGDSDDPNRTHALNGMVIRMLRAKAAGDTEFVVWGTGRPVREWIYMPDFAQFVLGIVESGTFDLPDPLNLAQGRGYSVRETAEAVKAAVGFEGELRFDTGKQDGAPIKVMDPTLFRKHFSVVFTPLSYGIKATVEYYTGLLAKTQKQ